MLATAFIAARVVPLQHGRTADGLYMAANGGLDCAFSIRQFFVDLFGESKDLLTKSLDLGHINIDPLTCL